MTNLDGFLPIGDGLFSCSIISPFRFLGDTDTTPVMRRPIGRVFTGLSRYVSRTTADELMGAERGGVIILLIVFFGEDSVEVVDDASLVLVIFMCRHRFGAIRIKNCVAQRIFLKR